MSTAVSSTDTPVRVREEPAWWRPIRDVGHLMWFRSAAVRRRTVFWWVLLCVAVLTVAIGVVPAYLPADPDRRLNVAVLLPSGMAGILAISVVSAVASGGGRELISRDQGGIHPISPTTDHLGALLLAPLNIAWLIQAWVLLGATAYAVGSGALVTSQSVTVLWLALATAIGQVVAWSVEAVRRRRYGLIVMRVLGVALCGAAAWVQLTGRVTDLLDVIPTRWLVVRGVGGYSWAWGQALLLEAALLLLTVALGAIPAQLAARRLPHDELRAESETRTPRRMPWSDLTALLRLDRASVWRAVPMRRGMAVLAIGPGLVALMGDLPWSTITILPGLVVSGGALLFGVNTWCLDGRGVLWRENLPAQPGLVFWVRALVLAEFLGVAALVTILIASLRAGIPSGPQLTAVACTVVVVTVQVVGAAMRWSEQRPYAVDLRSARATPAPPVVMVGYSARLALSTTLTGLVFSGLSRVPDPSAPLLVAIPFLAWSTVRLVRARRRWVDPFVRARVVTSVAG